MRGYQKFIIDMSKIVGFFTDSLTLSCLFISSNLFFLLFILTFKGLGHIIGLIISAILALTLLPSFVAILYTARQSKSRIRSYFKFLKRRVLWELSALAILVFIVIVVDLKFFMDRDVPMMSFIFTGLTVGTLVFIFNTAIVASRMNASFLNVIKVSIAYTKELLPSSFLAMSILCLPLFVVGPIAYLLVIGSAALVQVWASQWAHLQMAKTITSKKIEYL